MTGYLPSPYRHQPHDLQPFCEKCEYRYPRSQMDQVWVAGQRYDLCHSCGPLLAEQSSEEESASAG